MVDQLGFTQAAEALLECARRNQRARLPGCLVLGDRLDVEIAPVERVAAGRTVRTALARVQRVHADERCTMPCRQRDERAQVAEIADSPVARRAQSIQLHAEAPYAAAARKNLRLVAAPDRRASAPSGATRLAQGSLERLPRVRVDRLLVAEDVEIAGE